MRGHRTGTVHDSLRTLFHAGTFAGLTDGELLERFAERKGDSAETAFALLVERHGGIVLSTCRTILRDDHEAHDAFQATFLVLLRKANSIWVRDSLGPWLHRVAYRVAVHARRDSERRRRAEREAAERGSEARSESGWDDMASVVHEEVNRLQERYRIPVVLCDLEGRTYEEAARSLRCPVGTVKSRLARGRECLRGRLIRRGLAPASVLLVLDGHLRSARAVVPPTLIESTIRPAAQFAAGGTAAAEAIPEAVVRHAEGVLFTMIGARYSQITIVISAIFLVALTGGLFASRQQSGEEPSGGIAAVSGKAGTAPVTDGQVKPTPLARECIGTWVLVGTPEKIGQLPPTVNVLKFFTGRHWAVTQTDPKTGDVVEHHGGTYKLDGDQYTETVDYATANMADHIKKSHKFKIKVEGDTYTQIGIDNPWSQVWKCAK